MLVSIPKTSYDEHPEDVHIYSESMSKHHHTQYSRMNTNGYPQHAGKGYNEPVYYPNTQEYFYEPGPPTGYFNNNYEFGGPTEPVPVGPPAPSFGYMHQNNSSSQFSHSSTLSSPRLEHQLSHTSLPGSFPSPYSKEHPDMLTAMRNRTHSWSARGSRKASAFYENKWSMPYEPQMGSLGYNGGENDQLVSPLVSTFDENYGEGSSAMAAAAAAAAAAGERMRANSHPPYLYSPSPASLGPPPSAMPSAALPPAALPAMPAMPAPTPIIAPPPRPMQPSLDRRSSYGSNGSDNEGYSPTYGGDDTDERRSKRSATCPICNKILKRDLTRHMRTHEEVARFICPFPRSQCPHKRGQFNRPYDYKKHLLHHHFQFDKAKVVRRFRDLQSKLTCRGSCPCGQGNFTAAEWLDSHILGGQVCPLVQAESINQATEG